MFLLYFPKNPRYGDISLLNEKKKAEKLENGTPRVLGYYNSKQ
jgi:hypothetical protein